MNRFSGDEAFGAFTLFGDEKWDIHPAEALNILLKKYEYKFRYLKKRNKKEVSYEKSINTNLESSKTN